MKTNNRRLPFTLTAGAALAVLGAGAFLLTLPGCKPAMPTPPAPSGAPPIVSPPPRTGDTGEPAAPGAKRTVVVYHVVSDATDGDRLESKKIEVSGEKAQSPATAALEYMVGQPDSPLPKGTKVRSLDIADGLATVDFSPEFKDRFEGGETQEALVINAVLATLGQFDTVREVQILVEGKKIETLGGGKELVNPLTVPQDAETPPPPGAS
ncbi:MAG TPA: GerMN domain-containing protein [Armatimonadaceae bacterium]|nr:GerMN domain-containing protein [Armatimonadaceae bacterium]